MDIERTKERKKRERERQNENKYANMIRYVTNLRLQQHTTTTTIIMRTTTLPATAPVMIGTKSV